MKAGGFGRFASAILLVALGWLTGCEDDSGSSHDFGDNDPNVVVALGDSITHGFGLSGAETYPAVLAARTGKAVVNSGQDGEHSVGGLQRVGGLLKAHKPGYLLVMYGANDLIAQESPNQTVANLRGIVQAAKANKTVPILGQVTPAFGNHAFIQGGISALNPLISQMAGEEGVAVAGTFGALNDELFFQADGLHPNADGAAQLASAFGGKL